MSATPIVPGLWAVKIRFVNAYLLDAGNGLTLIDTGIANSAPAIVDAVRSIGRQPSDIRHILVTHCHTDHSGSLAAMKRLTGAPATMHALDAAMVREGRSRRPLVPAPGLLNAILCKLLIGFAPSSVEPSAIEHEASDGEDLPAGVRAIHVPGHCAGQLAFLWPEHGGVLIAGDVAANVRGLSLALVYEDLAEGVRSLSRLAGMDFEVACFGHGKPITSGASGQFRRKWRAARDASRQTA